MESVPVSVFLEILNWMLPAEQRETILRGVGDGLVGRGHVSPEQMALLLGVYEIGTLECTGCHNNQVREAFVRCLGCARFHHEQCIYKKGYCTRRCLLAHGQTDR